jgi:hypothetical protein
MPPPTTAPVKKYTRRADSTGWLSVRLTATNQLAALCEFTQVNITAERRGRTYLKIMDGTISVGEDASLTSANAALSLFERDRTSGRCGNHGDVCRRTG